MSSAYPAGDLLKRLAADLDAGSSPVGLYHDRTRLPAETLEALHPFKASMGVTRIGLLTGLDVIGIPVAFATRPNSRTLSVFQGKGLDVDAAMASAMMEAFETASAETQPSDVWYGSITESQHAERRIIDLDRTARCVPSRIDPTQNIPWCHGLDLMTGRPVHVPWWLVGLDHRNPRPDGFEQSSDGLASGNTLAEATLHGLCELVERDAWTLMLLHSNDELAAMRVEPAALEDAALDTLVDRVERAGFDLFLANMTSDLAVPAYAAVLLPRKLPRACDVAWAQICGGYGCHPIPARAAIRAVTEAAQTRLTLIAGSRDDLTPRQYRPSGNNESSMGDALALSSAPKAGLHPRSFGSTAETIQGRIRNIVLQLHSRGIREVVVVPIAFHDAGAAVVRVIVPGLEAGLEGENLQLGLRAARRMLGAAA